MALCKNLDRKELVRLNNGKRVRFEIQEHLGLRCRNGKTLFTLYYLVEGKKHEREMTLGEFPKIDLAQANRLARKYNKMLAEGKDPLSICKCTLPKKDKKTSKQNLFTMPLKKISKTTYTLQKKKYCIEFKDKDTYNHFLMLLSTLETNLEDLANYATDMRKLVVKK